MRVALDRAGHDYPEYLPDPIRASEDVPPIGEALEHAHYPTSFETRDAALRRLALDELLALQLGMVARRRAPRAGAHAGRPGRRRGRRADPVGARGLAARKLGEPASLTGDQATAIDEIRDDLARPVPMLRLVQGDVGSGKTAVAAWALAAAALAGRQAALLAPTDLLARQHHATLTSLLEDLGLPTTLLTGSLSGEGRRNATRGARLGAGGDRGRDARAAPGEGGVRRPRAGRRRRAAPVRRGAARGARGEGDAAAPRTSC